MIDTNISFKINSPQVVHETIDGEAVIIDMDTGSYYSLQHVGAAIWNFIDRRIQVKHIVAGICQQYSGDAEEMAEAVSQLLSQLQEEHLILPNSDATETSQPSGLPDLEGEKTEFVMPVLERFTDMQDLLLLDPIHEVDEAEGWPKKPQEQTQ
ncbi:MAG: PqqD family protein [bacterium]|nr:PqqD family protein [bacterium]